MNTIYITDHGVSLKKKSERMAIKKGNKIVEEIPLFDVKRVLIFGNNHISTDLLRYLSEKGIDVSFLSIRQRFQFRLVSETSKNIYLRMAQHRCYNNPEFRKNWSQKIVTAKIRNQKNLLLRILRKRSQSNIREHIDILDKCMAKVETFDAIDEIMGVEGYAAATYYAAFGQLILKGFSFTKRQYYPPPDPVNAMLSFGYMLICNELSALLEASGFDIFLGFLHSIKYGRASLATDLMEEFRSPIVDRLVLYLINLNVVHEEQFQPKPDGKGIIMNEDSKHNYLSNYEKFMTTSFIDYRSRNRTTFRQIFKEQVRQLEKCLLSDEHYEPFIFYE
ncbi:MAG: CRISP-associated protein Cas1 [Candidatus Magnetoglobus multicellularis str. Araruama]|uniref:CRISPR-associated endonuclease Cas1 n=1 Tax=Candidatus Magnetoglobus multicellularis str. Araruama TaxID=890399 RepID=A0A1V1P2G0_9BACT|nr:MAG: CRISP-associated protein Cas1 [Candidatus Magnetoglobus multicellularis str. Araruama]